LRKLKFVREQFFLATAAQNIKRLVRFLSRGPQPCVRQPLSSRQGTLPRCGTPPHPALPSDTFSTATPDYINYHDLGLKKKAAAALLQFRPMETMPNLSSLVTQLKKERDREKQLSVLNAALTAFANVYVSEPSHKRRKLSAKSRAKIAAAQRARWAKFRAKRKR